MKDKPSEKEKSKTGMRGNTMKTHGPGVPLYMAVWLGLLVLTGLTVLAASINFGGGAVVICLVIAAVKSALVLFYFMHLRYEERLVIKLIIPIALITLTIFITLTYSDVITR